MCSPISRGTIDVTFDTSDAMTGSAVRCALPPHHGTSAPRGSGLIPADGRGIRRRLPGEPWGDGLAEGLREDPELSRLGPARRHHVPKLMGVVDEVVELFLAGGVADEHERTGSNAAVGRHAFDRFHVLEENGS